MILGLEDKFKKKEKKIGGIYMCVTSQKAGFTLNGTYSIQSVKYHLDFLLNGITLLNMILLNLNYNFDK